MAPGATWIAAKIFNDSGTATATAIHQAFQWILDPDGNPATNDAPDVLNNSWANGSIGCNLEFQLDLQAIRASQILPVFAGGNFGPGTSTSVSPANYPESLAVGAVNGTDAIDASSSRGPSACGEPSTTYPEVVAPGVNIRTSDLFGFYQVTTGTSLAAPHVAGALALILAAHPGLTADQQAAALIASAVDLGVTGPDNTFGAGRLDVLAAHDWLVANPPAPSPAVTAITPTSGPTSGGTAVTISGSDFSTAVGATAWRLVPSRPRASPAPARPAAPPSAPPAPPLPSTFA
jgi:subtilisin family serine protease